MVSEGAFALSCMKPDLVKTLEEAKASDKVYHILAGKFVSEPTEDHDRGGYQLGPSRSDGSRAVTLPQGNKTPKITRAWFEGIAVAKHAQNDGQLTRFPVDIQTSCVGVWCSRPLPSDREVVAFVEDRAGQVPLLKISACPKWVFSKNVPVQVGNIRQCLDKDCTGLPLRSPDAYTHPRPEVNPRRIK